MESKPLLTESGRPAPTAPPGHSQPPAPTAPPGPRQAPAPTAPPGPNAGGPYNPAPPPYTGRTTYGGVVNNQPLPQGGGNAQVGVRPPNYFVLNVIAMIFCCFVCGLVGLITGLQADTSWKQGDTEAAYRNSRNAKRWGIGGIVGGCTLHCCTITTAIITGVALGLTNYYSSTNPYNN